MSENTPNEPAKGENVSENVVWHAGHVSRQDRAKAAGHKGATAWFTGLSGSGKSTVAVEVERRLNQMGHIAYLLDGDNVRHGLCGDLGFSAEDREENIRRIGEVAKLFADAGVLCLCSFVSPYAADRARVRELHDAGELPFIEVFVDTPIEICEQRDPKGLYKKARAGEIKNFTGISDPYEAPASPEIHLPGGELGVAELAERVIAEMTERGLLSA